MVITIVIPFVNTIWLLNTVQKLGIFKILFLFHFVIIFYSLFSHRFSATSCSIAVFNCPPQYDNDVKSIHVRKGGLGLGLLYSIKGHKGQNSTETRGRGFLVLESRCRGFLVLGPRCQGIFVSTASFSFS